MLESYCNDGYGLETYIVHRIHFHILTCVETLLVIVSVSVIGEWGLQSRSFSYVYFNKEKMGD